MRAGTSWIVANSTRLARTRARSPASNLNKLRPWAWRPSDPPTTSRLNQRRPGARNPDRLEFRDSDHPPYPGRCLAFGIAALTLCSVPFCGGRRCQYLAIATCEIFYHNAPASKLTYLSETNSIVICDFWVGEETSALVLACFGIKRSIHHAGAL